MMALNFKILNLSSNFLRNREQRLVINPIQDGPFRGCSRIGGSKNAPLSKICQTYPTMMKLGSYTLLKEDPKNI